MKSLSRSLVTLTLSVCAALAAGLLSGVTAWGQTAPPPEAKKPVQGYTRINKKTGQPVQVRSYKRRLPLPKAVEVRSYLRKGLSVMGHQRQRPGAAKP